MAELSTWRQQLQSVIGFQRSQLAILGGLRKGLVVAALLVGGLLMQHSYESLIMTIGAFSVGMTDQGGIYLPRIRTMLLACVGDALSVLVGASAAHILWLIVLLMALWGFGAGMLATVSQAATTIGLQAVAALAISSHFLLSPERAAYTAGLLFAGGLIQTLFTLAPWPLKRGYYERQALAAAYRALAASAEASLDREREQQATNALAQAGAVLAASVPRFGSGLTGQAFRALLDEGWGLRLALAALAEARQRLATWGNKQALDHLDELAGATAATLRAVAASLAAARVVEGADSLRRRLDHAIALLRRDQAEQDKDDFQAHAALVVAVERAEALCGQVRAALRTTSEWVQTGKSADTPEDGTRRPAALEPEHPLSIVRANLTLRSTMFRHALRLSLTLTIAALLAHLLLPGRGYWIPLTVVIVLRPNFSTTITRGLARGAGTLLGAALVTALIAALKPGPAVLVGLAAALACASYIVFQANIAFFDLFLTSYVVILISLTGTPPLTAALDRVIATLIGTALALAAILLWPSWERSQVPKKLADLLEADSRYVATALTGLLDPAERDPAEMHRRKLEAWLARSNAEASVQRSLHEPARYRVDAKVALGLLESSHRLGRSVLALKALYGEKLPDSVEPPLRAFAEDAQKALHLLATARREGAPLAPLPDLQRDQRALEALLEQQHQPAGNAPAQLAFLVAETEQMVNSLSTMRDLLAEEGAT